MISAHISFIFIKPLQVHNHNQATSVTRPSQVETREVVWSSLLVLLSRLQPRHGRATLRPASDEAVTVIITGLAFQFCGQGVATLA